MLIGEEGVKKLIESRVLLFGVGGVGSFAAEGLARAGVGRIGLCDGDTVSRSNLNRQLVALESTVGKKKTLVMADRIRDIDPHTIVTTYDFFYSAETEDLIDFSDYDYIIDAIDTVTAKLLIIQRAVRENIPVVSCMGTGNKLDPTAVRLTDISKTSGCPLARVMRRELRLRGINHLPVVFSEESPLTPLFTPDDSPGRHVPGSVSFVPPAAGMTAASAAVRHIVFGN